MLPRYSSRSGLSTHFTSSDLPLHLRFGGHRCTLRWLQPDDADGLVEFFRSHSEETIYRRYGYAGVQMTPENAARLVSVDQTRDVALGVFEKFDHELRLIAVGRYCLESDGTSAEIAFVVHEDRRALGIGTTLFNALIAIAREGNLQRLIAYVRNDNGPMIAMLRAQNAKFAWTDATSMSASVRLARAHPHAAAHKAGHHAALLGTEISKAAAQAALRVEEASIALQKMPLP